MTPTANSEGLPHPAQRLRWMQGLVLVLASLLTLAGLVWAAVLPRLPDVTSATATGARAPDRPHPPAPQAWTVAWWQPLTDTPVAPVAPVALNAQLVSVVKQRDTLVAAIDFQDGTGLVYAKAGDTVQGYLVTHIDAHAVTVTRAGTTYALALGP